MLQNQTSPIAADPGHAPTFAEQAFNKLREDILNAKLLPGQKMYVERLKDSYGVGATPLREALSKLSSIDLVVAEGQRGFRVAPVSLANLLDITRNRAWIESLALRTAIANGDREWEAQILASCHRLEGFTGPDGEPLSNDWYRENRNFHDALVRSCNSPQIMAFRAQLYDLSDRYRRLSVHDGLRGRDFNSEHRRIMQAVLDRDADAAVRLTEDHFIDTILVILQGEPELPASPAEIIRQLRHDIQIGLSSGRSAA